MEVVVESLLSGTVSGRSAVRTVATATVDSVIAAFCAERGVNRWQNYILADKDDIVLDNSYTLNACSVGDGDTLYLTARGGHETTLGFHNWWIMAIVSAIIGTVGLVAVSVMFASPNPAVDDFGIVFDAGSTHTLMHVYRWPGEKTKGTGEPVQIGRCQQNKGIAQLAENPENVTQLLLSCLDEARGVTVPQDRVLTTPVFLGATGGMRLLQIRNGTQAQRVMVAARLAFASSGFSFSSPDQQVRVLEGAEEGADAWVTANYLNATLARVAGDKTPTVGTLDLGGASLQIAFQTNPSTSITTVQAFGISHDLYSTSYLCFGAKEANRRLLAQLALAGNGTVEVPCLPKGFAVSIPANEVFQVPCANVSLDSEFQPVRALSNFTFQGTGDYARCSSQVRTLMNASECSTLYSYCFAPPQIPLPSVAFMGLANFDFVMESLNLTDGTPSLAKYDEAVSKLCEGSQAAGNETLCFQSVYVRAVLVDGFGFNSSTWNSLVFVDSMKDTDVDWALGYMMKETNGMPAEVAQPRMGVATFSALMVCFAAFFLLAVAFGVHAYKLRSVSPSYQRFSQYGAI